MVGNTAREAAIMRGNNSFELKNPLHKFASYNTIFTLKKQENLLIAFQILPIIVTKLKGDLILSLTSLVQITKMHTPML